MDSMSAVLHWDDVVVRLACAVIAGTVFGLNRTERGKPAGLRTTVLVCLAATVAMLQVNFLMPLDGRPAGSFIMNDLMRFPLGILTGVGFIGAGVILRRDALVVGVTTAATLWYVTVIGLCFGGGQIGLGIVATGLGLVALWPMNWLELRVSQERSARLTIETGENGPSEDAIKALLQRAGMIVVRQSFAWGVESGHRQFIFDLREVAPGADAAIPAVVNDFTRESGVERVNWSTSA